MLDANSATVEGMPSQQSMMRLPELRTVFDVADSVGRGPQRDPSLFVPVADRIAETVVAGDRTPTYSVSMLGLIHDVGREAVPEATVKKNSVHSLATCTDSAIDRGRRTASAVLGIRLFSPNLMEPIQRTHPTRLRRRQSTRQSTSKTTEES